MEKEYAYFAGGCFWGMEYLMSKQEGVLNVESGFMGGTVRNPSYNQVRTGRTGHAETVKITFDPLIVPYETLAKLFFEIHDPEQVNSQGPDVGLQYRSVAFYVNVEQKNIIVKLINILKDKGYNIVTEVILASEFYKAENYHQHYYELHDKDELCHFYTKRF
ncbi:MAG: peptide-methionine (S)-S-oxide reductase MsrA [Bacteroidales bacterium]